MVSLLNLLTIEPAFAPNNSDLYLISYLFPRKCFEFSHPNWELTSNDRWGG